MAGPFRGGLLCLGILATRKRVYELLQTHLVCYLIFCQLAFDVLLNLLLIPPNCVYIIPSYPKMPISIEELSYIFSDLSIYRHPTILWGKYDTVLNHTGLYEYRHGKLLMHLRFTFESLNSPGEYMRYYRQLRGLTTRQLAEKLNIVPATVLAYEQERFPIPYEISIAAAETLHISEELLFDDFCIFISAPYTEILHTVRKRYGLNQVDFAQKAGISPSIYAKWEAGNRRPSRKMYQQLKAIYPEI